MNKELYKAYYKDGEFNFIWACDWIDAIFLIMDNSNQFFPIDDLTKLELASKEEKEGLS